MTSTEINDLLTVRRIAGRVLRWGMTDMVLGALCGGIFGAVFGGLGQLVHFNVSPILSIVGYFSFCGAAAGVLVGTCGVIIDDTNMFELPRRSPISEEQRAPSVATEAEPGPAARPEVRAAFDLTTVRRPREVAASQKPSWN